MNTNGSIPIRMKGDKQATTKMVDIGQMNKGDNN